MYIYWFWHLQKEFSKTALYIYGEVSEHMAARASVESIQKYDCMQKCVMN